MSKGLGVSATAPNLEPSSSRVPIHWGDNPRRSLLIGVAGAIVGLAIAGFGLFTAKGTAVRTVPPEDAAMVNQKPILASDLAAQVQTAYNKPLSEVTAQQRRKVLEDMIREELMVQRGLELDEPGADPDTRAALVNAVQTQVSADATSQVPTEAELIGFYGRRQAQYARMGWMTVRDLLLPSSVGGSSPERLARAQGAVDDLREGRPIDQVARQAGMRDSGRVSGEELYFAAKIHLGEPLFYRAAALSDGQISDPIPSVDGVHVLVMTHNVRPAPRSFQEARSQVYSDYKDDLTTRLHNAEDRYLRSKADIVIAPQYR